MRAAAATFTYMLLYGKIMSIILLKGSMFVLRDISVSIESQPIVKNVTLQCKPGSVHALMGPNGSGKSTLAHAIMGNPENVITSGAITLGDTNLGELSVFDRARAGVCMTFQQPPALEGVQVFTFLHESYKALHNSDIEFAEFFHKLETLMEQLGIDRSLLERSVNVGFSGGQKKMLELLQIVLFRPRVVVCDELDSGLDVDALQLVARGLLHVKQECPETIFILITHYQRILNYVVPDYVHVMRKGTLIKTGDSSLAEDIELLGYDAI